MDSYEVNFDYLWKPWTVRTYNILARNGLQVHSPEEAIEIAEACLQGYYRNAGRQMAVELFRAAGLGVYNIYDRLGGALPVERLKTLVDKFDRNFHEIL